MSDMQEMPEPEATMGTGRLLGLFFGLAIVCAVFFGLGFELGHSTTSSIAQAAPATDAAVQPVSAHGTPDVASPDASKDSASKELSFLKPSEPKEKDVPPPDVAAVAASVPPIQAAPAPKAQKPGHSPRTPMLQSGFVAQVAAVRRREDAETLMASLRKKNYPVFIAAESPDKLFHVQVGPFADKKDAQAMKEKLSSDGYNSMVK